MKKLTILVLLFLLIGMSHAAIRRSLRRPLIEIGPKASLYVGSVRGGFGAEFVVNPLRNFGLRMDIAELSFGDGPTEFFFNLRALTLDGMIYLPVSGIRPYAFVGFGIGADGHTDMAFRGGLGFNYSVTRSTDLFMEPGMMIIYNSARDGDETDVWFRFSMGGRFGILR
ncbi:MAG: hypothetical protein JSV98_10035 [candidate division WOR-3 bacterium]|nr:MAG: hypothetical protein JSV98_10035 [candidate division WOR-3 bacterium]